MITNFPNGVSSFGAVLPFSIEFPLGGKHIYVNTITGSDANDGLTPETAKSTMSVATGAFSIVASRDVIHLTGKVREQVVAPLGVYGVTIIGNDTRPRHDLAASWLAPVSPTASKSLLELREQGWQIFNLLMDSTGITASYGSIKLTRAESATYPDPSHVTIAGCRFVGVDGIIDSGGGFNNCFINNTFQGLTGTAIKNVSGAGIAIPTEYVIQGNRFLANANCIDTDAKYFKIQDNVFLNNTAGTIINISRNSSQNNAVVNNFFDIAAASFDPAGGITGSSTDVWSNYLSDAIETGVPAN